MGRPTVAVGHWTTRLSLCPNCQLTVPRVGQRVFGFLNHLDYPQLPFTSVESSRFGIPQAGCIRVYPVSDHTDGRLGDVRIDKIKVYDSHTGTAAFGMAAEQMTVSIIKLVVNININLNWDWTCINDTLSGQCGMHQEVNDRITEESAWNRISLQSGISKTR